MTEESESKLSGSNSSEFSTAYRVAIKPPPFYFGNPAVWFKNLESQFVLAGVTNAETKYHHVIAALPENVAINLPEEADYDLIKNAILKNFTKSQTEKLEDALGAVSLEGQKPSVCLNRILRQFRECGITPEESVIRHKLLMALPQQVRQIMATHSDKNLETFAAIADTIIALPNITMDTRVCAISNEKRNWKNVREHEGDFPASLRPFSPGQRQKICKAHIYYASKARNCRPWCQWPKKNCPVGPSTGTPINSRSNSPVPGNSSSPLR